MSPPVDFSGFRDEYRRAVKDVMRFVTPERQELIARHNLGLHPSRTDLTAYLEASEERYVRAVGLFNAYLPESGTEHRALDVGGFLGSYPLTLVRLGLSVTLAEVYDYYHGAFDDLSAYLASAGIEIWDVDFTAPLGESAKQRFTMVTNMAMLEHLASSPEVLMRNLHAVTDERGALVIETPNVAYWPNRLTLLRGRSIHPPLEVVYRSASPFLGHHREYTATELTDLLRWSGFSTRSVEYFNYTIRLRRGTRVDRLYTLLLHLWPTLLFPNCRELIMALAVPGPVSVDGAPTVQPPCSA
jgi:2-polyprenyl-3-methyl-5-hydroxy-6-metoxy-1,4-benzoquinol methylase